MAIMSKKIKVNKSEVLLYFDDNFELFEAEKEIIEAVKKVKKFFSDLDHKNINIKIKLVYSRQEYERDVKRKTERWEIAYTWDNFFIIFHPNVIESETNHNKDEFGKILIHEITHTIINSINQNLLCWINEGVALYVAGQTYPDKTIDIEDVTYFIENSFYKNSDLISFANHSGYEISFKLVKYLSEKYGQMTITSLLKIKVDEDIRSQLELVFDKSLKDLEREIIEVLKNSS